MNTSNKINIGIIGATGYTGVELLRLLLQHPNARVSVVTSRTEAGIALSDYFPSLRGFYDHLVFSDPQTPLLDQCDLVFFATPHGVAMQEAPHLIEKGIKVIDLSADFRLQDSDAFAQYYNMPHAQKALLKSAVYGLPELKRAEIKNAKLVANPGCYPTLIQVALAPFLKAEILQASSIIADCKSGISGAGRKADIGILFSESSDNFKAYGVQKHRHQPEIEQGLRHFSKQANIIFTPHLLPTIRGMFASIYAPLQKEVGIDQLQSCLSHFYQNEPFIDVLAPFSTLEMRSVRGSNKIRLSIAPKGNHLIIFGIQDNLVKGAAGQAIQNMNILFDLAETTGLLNAPLSP